MTSCAHRVEGTAGLVRQNLSALRQIDRARHVLDGVKACKHRPDFHHLGAAAVRDQQPGPCRFPWHVSAPETKYGSLAAVTRSSLTIAMQSILMTSNCRLSTSRWRAKQFRASYRWQQPGEKPGADFVTSRITLERRPCRLGGNRTYFICPCCLRRVLRLAVLPEGLRCGPCGRVTWASRRERPSTG